MKNNKKNILVVFGTRPEGIKLAPLIQELQKNPNFNVITCVFRQHKKTLDQVLSVFQIVPTFDLNITINDQDLLGKDVHIISKLFSLLRSGVGLLKFLRILKSRKIDLLVVQGDTSTTFLAAFLAFHFKIKIAHIEAGLRTNDKYSPFPEEVNRRLNCVLADFHFAPTESAKQNLIREGVDTRNIWVTGNTAIDAFRLIYEKIEKEDDDMILKKIKREQITDMRNKKLIVVTAHRRENFGDGLKNICGALKKIALLREDVIIIYPVHHNPNVRTVVGKRLENIKNIILLDPLDYDFFVSLLYKAHIVLTDSGGIQEEVSIIGKPVLIMRENTEREEAIKGGNAKLIGTSEERVVEETIALLENPSLYSSMSKIHYSFGDGHAAEKIADIISKL